MRCDWFRSLTAASAKPEDCGNGVVGTRLACHSWLPSGQSTSAPSPRRARVLMKRGRLLPIFRNANTYTPKTMKQILTPFRILSTLALLATVGCSPASRARNIRSKPPALQHVFQRLRRSSRSSRAFPPIR